MEKVQRQKLSKKFPNSLKGKRVICLDIPENYEYSEPSIAVG
ncbi:MAG: hypothetical protein QNJ64_12070 [Crocosphaera sp.]|nr:hypothetical protein [Crocosphaera sp.]